MKLKHTLPALLIIILFVISCGKDPKVVDEPKVTFSNTSVTNVTSSKALITSQLDISGGLQVTEQGFVLGTAANPTVSDLKKKSDTLKTGTYSLQINALLPNTTYYARAYAIASDGKTYYGDDITISVKGIALEDNFGGGIVVWLDATGQHGIVAAQQGLNFSAEWGCKGTHVPGTLAEIGSGQANTNAILKTCSNTTKAAKFCDTLTLNGFKDWYLPSKDELSLLYEHRAAIGFSNTERWSSTEGDNFNSAWAQPFDPTNGAPLQLDKSTVHGVRPVRSF
ncbi:MAG: DUF1566 domain-containing protein [Ginsengibacter sp.]